MINRKKVGVFGDKTMPNAMSYLISFRFPLFFQTILSILNLEKVAYFSNKKWEGGSKFEFGSTSVKIFNSS